MIDLAALEREILDVENHSVTCSAMKTIEGKDESPAGPMASCSLTDARFSWPRGGVHTYPTSRDDNIGCAQALVALWLELDQEEAE